MAAPARRSPGREGQRCLDKEKAPRSHPGGLEGENMKLRRVISGGQTGADQAGLACARILGLETGGWAPRGWMTEDGPAPWLGPLYGLQECQVPGYPARTRLNVAESDATIWVGLVTTPGFYCTWKACHDLQKPFLVNPGSLQESAETYHVLNIAGNRARKNPQVVGLVEALFRTLSHWPEETTIRETYQRRL